MDKALLLQIFKEYKGQPGFVINTWTEFSDFVNKAHPAIVEAAKQKRLIKYKEIAAKIGLSHLSPYFQTKIGFIVGACSEYEDRQEHPIISAIVVNEETHYPGVGFWNLSRIRNSISMNIQYSNIESGYTMTDEMLTFWSSEVSKVYEWWQTHDC